VKLSCPSCSAKYSIADEKVQDRLAKIRCRKCSATIIIDGKIDPPNVYTSDGQASEAGGAAAPPGDVGPGEYSVDFGDSDQRTMSIAQIVAAYNEGSLTAETYVWTEGMGDWSPLGAVPEINNALHAAHAVAAQPSALVDEAQRAATRTGAGRGSATDLFGSVAKAGSEEDVTTSAPQPALPAAGAIATGARNESSVLFSLSALTAAAAAPEPAQATASSSSSSSDGGDDSGLIDLKALTSVPNANEAPVPLIAGPALGLGAPLGGMTAPAAAVDIDEPVRKGGNKTGLMIMGGMLGMGLLIAGAIIATSGGGQDDAAAAAASAAAMEPMRTPTGQPDPATVEEKKDEVTAKPPATGTAEPEEAPKAEAAPTATAKTVRAGTTKPRVTAPKTEAAPAPSPAPAPKSAESSDEAPKKKKKKSAECNCNPADLMCAMKCAAG
jgi:predicted Zn finger-like uncharacterized protein